MSQIPIEVLEELIDTECSATKSPKYVQIFDAFADGIRSGRLKPGQRIPPETRLCEYLPFSLGTLQKALSNLAASGLVIRRQRSGTFIADRNSQAAEAFVFRFRDPQTNRIQLPFVRAVAVTEDDSDGPWRSTLGDRRCIRLDRLLWVDQDPPAFASVYFTHKHGKDLLNVPIEQLHGSSTHRLLLDKFNLPSLRLEHAIGCRELSKAACRHLLIPAGTVGTIWDVCEFSVRDQPLLFQRLQLPPDHRPLEISEVVRRAKY